MMVDTFNDFSGFAAPDRQVMKASKNHFNLAVADKTFAFIPAVQEKTLYVRDQLNLDDQQMGEDIKRVIASLANVGFAALLARIEEIQSASTAPASLREEKIEEHLKYCYRRVASAKLPVDDALKALRQMLLNLDSVRFTDAGSDLERIESDRLARMNIKSSRLNDDRTKLLQEKSNIDVQIGQFNAPGWLEIFNKSIPSAAEIEAALKLVSTKKPDREFLELVLKRLKGNLEGIEEGHRYSNLAEARDSVRQRINEVQSELAELEAQIRDQQGVLEKHRAIAELDVVTANWLREAKKVLAVYEHFSGAHVSQMTRDVQTLQAIALQHEAMLCYLRGTTWR